MSEAEASRKKPKELKRVVPLIKNFCKPLGSPGVKRMCIPVLFAVSCLLISGGKNESKSLLRDLGDVKELS